MTLRISRRANLSSKTLLFLGGLAILTAPLAGFAQTDTSQASQARAKPMAFEVVSIRQHKGDDVTPSYGPTANGYHMTNMTLIVSILTAYVPQTGGSALYMNNQVKGLPDWIRERFDVDATVSEADLAEWQKPSAQNVMLQAMLQTMLADRLKLEVHRDIKEVPMYSLVVGKSGPKFKEANDAETHQGVTLPNGGGTVVPEDGGPYDSLLCGSDDVAGAVAVELGGPSGRGQDRPDREVRPADGESCDAGGWSRCWFTSRSSVFGGYFGGGSWLEAGAREGAGGDAGDRPYGAAFGELTAAG